MSTALFTSSRTHHRRPKTQSNQRLDIQGLRMIAVMLVVLSHLFDWPRGGFIGVDVFFVISGFLITGSLLHTVEKTGTISFSSFYRRRVRRIVPAATLVLVATVAASYFTFSSSRFDATVIDALWAFLFVSNWRFGLEGTDYFAADNAVSPLQHYWSLSVEEQFYFVWPAVILAVSFFALRKALPTSSRLNITVAVMGVAVLGSFAYSWYDTAHEPTWAYFSTLTRVWELGVGALLAITIRHFDRLPDHVRPILAWGGLIMIVIGAFAITEAGGGFPAPWAILPVLGAAMVIGAGTQGDHRFLRILTNRISTYIGDISYSLYLWHWPVIILLGTLMEPTPYYYVGSLFLMFGFSILAYHFFENPIRQSKWLLNEAERRDRRFLDVSRWRLPQIRMSERNQSIGIGATALVTAGLVTVVMVPTTSDANPYASAYTPDVPGVISAPIVELTGRAKDIQDALNATSWPENLTPALDTIRDAIPPEDYMGCGTVSHTDPNACMFGSGDKLAVVVGDSVSLTWLSGVREALVPQGWQVRGLSRAACPYVEAAVLKEGQPNPECVDHQQWVRQRIQQLKPDLVIASNAAGHLLNLQSKAVDGAANTEWSKGAEASISGYVESGAKVVVLSPVPSGQHPEECATKSSVPANCVSQIPSVWRSATSVESAAAAKFGATFVDTSSWFCSDKGACPLFVGNTTVRRDKQHITPEYSRSLAPEISGAVGG